MHTLFQENVSISKQTVQVCPCFVFISTFQLVHTQECFYTADCRYVCEEAVAQLPGLGQLEVFGLPCPAEKLFLTSVLGLSVGTKVAESCTLDT